MKGVLGYTEDKVVATDFRGESCTSVFDADAGIALDGTFVKVVAWYDNEWGYSCKVLEMVRVMHEIARLVSARCRGNAVAAASSARLRGAPIARRTHQEPFAHATIRSPRNPAVRRRDLLAAFPFRGATSVRRWRAALFAALVHSDPSAFCFVTTASRCNDDAGGDARGARAGAP